jgi:hypothetical protein
MRRRYSTLVAIALGILIVILSVIFALLENLIGQ